MFHHDSQIPSEAEREQFQAAYCRLSHAVSESLRMFTYVVDEFQKRASDTGSDVHAIPQMLMFDFAEAIDGVVVLAAAGAARNCDLQLRTALEILLNLSYLMDKPEEYARRAVAYEFFHLNDKLKWAERCDPTTNLGRELARELQGDEFAGVFDMAGKVDVKAEIEKAKKKVESERYREVREEIARMKKAKHWYSLWGGPDDLRKLAKSLNCLSMYEALYRSWSNTTHGEGALKRISGGKDGVVLSNPIRSPKGLEQACLQAFNLTNMLSRFIVEKAPLTRIRDTFTGHFKKEVKTHEATFHNIKFK